MKQRLVGILVLGCLAIILIPLLLDGDGIKAPPLSSTIPPAPKFDSTAPAEPTRPVIAADSLPAPGQDAPSAAAATTTPAPTPVNAPVAAVPAASSLPAYEDKVAEPAKKPSGAGQPDALEAAVASIMAKDKKPVATTDNTPALDSSGLPQSWVVRMGSFADRKNADALVQRLIAAGFKGYARSLDTDKGKMFAVYAGPVLTKAEATSLQGKLATCKQGKCVVEPFTNPSLQMQQ